MQTPSTQAFTLKKRMSLLNSPSQISLFERYVKKGNIIGKFEIDKESLNKITDPAKK